MKSFVKNLKKIIVFSQIFLVLGCGIGQLEFGGMEAGNPPVDNINTEAASVQIVDSLCGVLTECIEEMEFGFCHGALLTSEITLNLLGISSSIQIPWVNLYIKEAYTQTLTVHWQEVNGCIDTISSLDCSNNGIQEIINNFEFDPNVQGSNINADPVLEQFPETCGQSYSFYLGVEWGEGWVP